MAYFNRFDIVEAYLTLENDWNKGGWLHERPSNQRRREASHVQIARLGFKRGADLDYFRLSTNGREIYRNLCSRYGFTFPDPDMDTKQVLADYLEVHPDNIVPLSGKTIFRDNNGSGDWRISRRKLKNGTAFGAFYIKSLDNGNAAS